MAPASLSPEELLEEETDSQYRKKCITVLCAIFDVQRPTVRKWGRVLHIGTKSVQDWGQDMSFRKMPQIHRHTLGYALAAISQTVSSKTWETAA